MRELELRTDYFENSLEENWELLRDPTHIDHEGLIWFLQQNPDPRSVPYIKEAIQLKPHLEYLEYDDYGAYYNKCLWALWAINTPEALELIRECSLSEIPELREKALYRLKRIRESA